MIVNVKMKMKVCRLSCGRDFVVLVKVAVYGNISQYCEVDVHSGIWERRKLKKRKRRKKLTAYFLIQCKITSISGYSYKCIGILSCYFMMIDCFKGHILFQVFN